MLWSLFKLIIFICVVAAATYGASLLLDESQGGIRVEAAGYEITLEPLQSVIALAVLVVAVWLLLKLIGLLRVLWLVMNGDETAWTRYRYRRKLSSGYDALAEGMMALASGDGRLAVLKAEKAAKKLDRPELTNLLTAQAAEMTGDKKKAEETYRKLIADQKTKFVGVRGVMKQRLADGDTETAMELAKAAFALKPQHEETQDTLLRLQATSSDWAGARQTLASKLKHGSMPRDVHKRRDAVLALAEAEETPDDIQKMNETVLRANKMSPELIPAAVKAAGVYAAKGQKRQATRAIKAAWAKQAHPELAQAFAAIEPNETSEARLRRFQDLARVHPDDPETKMLLTELHLTAEDFPAARRALGDLAETKLTVRVATLMAAIEKGEGASDAVVKGWLARAVTAPRGPAWVCDVCQTVHATWVAVCPVCGAIDSLTWRDAPQADVVTPAGADMLPLLVGSDDPVADAENPIAIVPTEEAPAESADAPIAEIVDEPVKPNAA